MCADIMKLSAKKPRLQQNEKPKPTKQRKLQRRAKPNALLRRKPRTHEDLQSRIPMTVVRRMRLLDESVYVALSRSLI